MEDDLDWMGSLDSGDEGIQGDNLQVSEGLSQLQEGLVEEKGLGAQSHIFDSEDIGEAPLMQELVPTHNLNQTEEYFKKNIPIPTSVVRHDKPPVLDNIGKTLTNKIEVESERQAVQIFDVNRVPISVAMNVGILNMSKNKLDELRVDDTIELGGSETGVVTLVANGCEIGVGRLVSVNEQLAVQIISIGI